MFFFRSKWLAEMVDIYIGKTVTFLQGIIIIIIIIIIID